MCCLLTLYARDDLRSTLRLTIRQSVGEVSELNCRLPEPTFPLSSGIKVPHFGTGVRYIAANPPAEQSVVRPREPGRLPPAARKRPRTPDWNCTVARSQRIEPVPHGAFVRKWYLMKSSPTDIAPAPVPTELLNANARPALIRILAADQRK